MSDPKRVPDSDRPPSGSPWPEVNLELIARGQQKVVQPPAGPTPSLRDELFSIRTRCERSLRLLMQGIDGVVIEDTRRTLMLIDKSAKAAMFILDAQEDR